MTLDRGALVLNQNYEPLHVCAARRAFVLVFRGKAEILEAVTDGIAGVESIFPLPSVIRLRQQVRRPRPRVRLTRREVFARDGHRCMYCGHHVAELTLDHVFPRNRGGKHEWENIVAACQPCNHRKGGRTPSEAKMRLLRAPVRPAATPATLFGHYLEHYQEWRPFLSGWLDPSAEATAAS